MKNIVKKTIIFLIIAGSSYAAEITYKISKSSEEFNKEKPIIERTKPFINIFNIGEQNKREIILKSKTGNEKKIE